MTAYLIPEWAEQDAVMLAWPHDETDWANNLPQIEQVYIDLIRQITRFEKVLLLVHSEELKSDIKSRFLSLGIRPDRIIFFTTKYNDTWLRDTGPLAVKSDDGTKLLDFRFNGWGGKFNAELDDKLCQHLFESKLFTHCRKISLPHILEGGSIDTNGDGVLLTTRQCLLSKTRNPELTTTDYERMFYELLGTEHVFWIENSDLIGDDTDGHIDMLARFCNKSTIAYSSCNNINDPQFACLDKMQKELLALKTPEGNPYNLMALPVPDAIRDKNGNRLSASYANFLIINGAVLVPIYGDKNDAIAIDQLSACFPDREIVGINALPVIEQSGSLHCLSMQIPKGILQS